MSNAISLELLAFNLKLLGRQRRKDLADQRRTHRRQEAHAAGDPAHPVARRRALRHAGHAPLLRRARRQEHRDPQDHRQPLAQHSLLSQGQSLRSRHQRPDRRRRLRRKLGRQAHPQALDRERHPADHRRRRRHRDPRADHHRRRARHLPLSPRRRLRALEPAPALPAGGRAHGRARQPPRPFRQGLPHHAREPAPQPGRHAEEVGALSLPQGELHARRSRRAHQPRRRGDDPAGRDLLPDHGRRRQHRGPAAHQGRASR